MNATIKIRHTLYHNNYDITNNTGRNDNDHHRSQRRQQRQQRQQRQRRQQRHQQRLSSVIRGVHILSNNFVTLEWFSMADCFKAGAPKRLKNLSATSAALRARLPFFQSKALIYLYKPLCQERFK